MIKSKTIRSADVFCLETNTTVGEMGVEPIYLTVNDFKSFVYTIPPLAQYGIYCFEVRARIEPAHKSFADSCLPTWLPDRRASIISGMDAK